MTLAPSFEMARARLARVTVTSDHQFHAVLHEVATIAAEALGVGRVSVWHLLDDRQGIRCDFLYQRGDVAGADGVVLYRADFERYFKAIELRRVVRVADVRDDPVAAEFRERYFEPLGITAMLDVPIYKAGVVDGIVCHEHLDSPRAWTDAEAEFASTVGETIARLFGESVLHTAREALGLYRRELDQMRQVGALGRLAAGIAHDFAKVLQVVQGHAELLEDTSDTLVHAHARDIRRAAESGRRMIDELLRLESPGRAVTRVVDVSEVMARIEPMLRMAAGSRVQFVHDAPAGLPRVLIDPSQLERALVNLVANARDAMPVGGAVKCSAFATSHARDGHASTFVTLEVSDEGAGMDTTTTSRMFEPFFTTKSSGSGLGLAVVQQFVVMAGGFVDVQSAPGVGSTIRLHLPAIAGADRRQPVVA